MSWNKPSTWFKKIEKRDFNTSGYDVPEKVYITQDGGVFNEWSTQEPAMLRHNFYDLLYGFYGCQNFIELFYSVPEVFAPVHEIAKRVSDCNWQLCKDWNDQVDYNDQDFNRLFTQPNPMVAFKDFVYQAVCYEILVGKQLFFFNKPDALADEYKSIIGWWNLPAQKVTADLKPNIDPYTATDLNDFINFYQMPLNGNVRKFDVAKVLPICHLSLNTGFNINDTKSLLLGAEKAIRNLIPVYEARGVIYIKRGALGFLVSRKSDASGNVPLTPKEKQNVNDEVNGRYGLHRRKDTFGVVAEPVDWVQTSMSIEELQPFDETLADATAIYSVLRVPKHLIPSKDQSTYANADADLKSFYSDVIIPWAKRYAEAWTNFMKLKDFRRYINADFSHIDVLQENEKEKADVDKINGEVYLQRWQNGVASLNEWIVANDGTKVTGIPFYDKKIFEMDETELAQVKAALNLRSVVTQPADQSQTDKTNPNEAPSQNT